MSVEQDLFDIEQGFWLSGQDHFLAHLGKQCILAFPQAGEMHGVKSREEIAATATTTNRWRDLEMTSRAILMPSAGVAIITYRAEVTRADGQPYSALVSSAYAASDDGWKLVLHQHSPI